MKFTLFTIAAITAFMSGANAIDVSRDGNQSGPTNFKAGGAAAKAFNKLQDDLDANYTSPRKVIDEMYDTCVDLCEKKHSKMAYAKKDLDACTAKCEKTRVDSHF